MARVWRRFFISSLAREMEFRANFFAKMLQNATWVLFFVLMILVIYRNTNSVAGWSRPDAFLLAGTTLFIGALFDALFFHLMEIPSHVRMGTMDFIVTKPIDSQFWISSRKFNFDRLGTIGAGILLIGYAMVTRGQAMSFLQVSSYLLLLGCSLALYYSFNLVLMTTGIWFVRVDNLWVLGETVLSLARNPLEIFGSFLQRMFIYIAPIGFIAWIPCVQIVHGFQPLYLFLGVVWAAAGLIFARGFWRWAMRSYSSASS